MSDAVAFTAHDKPGRYRELALQVASLVEGEPDLIANLANATAAIAACLPIASWVGFYIRRDNELVLGPFQGKVACVRIAFDRGVCGKAASERRTVIVPDVAEFPGHIACDAGSRSEIVVPILVGEHLAAVLDLDSYERGAFDDEDAAGLAPLAAILGTLAW